MLGVLLRVDAPCSFVQCCRFHRSRFAICVQERSCQTVSYQSADRCGLVKLPGFGGFLVLWQTARTFSARCEIMCRVAAPRKKWILRTGCLGLITMFVALYLFPDRFQGNKLSPNGEWALRCDSRLVRLGPPGGHILAIPVVAEVGDGTIQDCRWRDDKTVMVRISPGAHLTTERSRWSSWKLSLVVIGGSARDESETMSSKKPR